MGSVCSNAEEDEFDLQFHSNMDSSMKNMRQLVIERSDGPDLILEPEDDYPGSRRPRRTKTPPKDRRRGKLRGSNHSFEMNPNSDYLPLKNIGKGKKYKGGAKLSRSSINNTSYGGNKLPGFSRTKDGRRKPTDRINLSGEHKPSSIIAERTSKMNKYSEKAQMVAYSLPAFTAFGNQDHSNNPVYGPYLYKETGDTYLGQYFRGQRCGKGELVTPSGEVYIGHWDYDQCNGKGRLILPKGDYFEGDFENNQAEGEGRFVNHALNIVYQGQFRNDMQEGKGKETYPDGGYYYGDFIGDKKHGNGEFVFADGTKYVGRFQNDFIQGVGEFLVIFLIFGRKLQSFVLFG